jgi:hypothetical protein
MIRPASAPAYALSSLPKTKLKAQNRSSSLYRSVLRIEVATPDLPLPQPRPFVLLPLSEIRPDFR